MSVSFSQILCFASYFDVNKSFVLDIGRLVIQVIGISCLSMVLRRFDNCLACFSGFKKCRRLLNYHIIHYSCMVRTLKLNTLQQEVV